MATTYTPAELVAMAWDRGEALSNSLSTQSVGFLNQALGVAGSAARMNPAALSFSAAVAEPDVIIPKLAEGASMELFDSWWNGITDQLTERFSWFISTYFPNECDYLGKAQGWICKALTSGGTGIAPRVEEQIWERDRSRILRDAARAEEEAMTSFAARGFPLPPGALAGMVQRIRNDAQDRVAQSSRERAIQAAQLEVENVRFAVQQAVGLYTSAVGAARDFISALASTSGVSAQLIPSVTDSQSRLISAASSYYQARIAVKELELKASTTGAEFNQQANTANQAAQMQVQRAMVDSALEAAKMLATQAAAALNAFHISVGTDARVATTVGYNYGGDVSTDVPPKTGT